MRTDATAGRPPAVAVSAAHSQEPTGSAGGETLQRRVTIVNPQGFHMRPQSLFVQRAKQFVSTVTVCRGDRRVDGKSQWELMLLNAEPGTELLLEVRGADAAVAVEVLAELLAAPHVEEPATESLPPKG